MFSETGRLVIALVSNVLVFAGLIVTRRWLRRVMMGGGFLILATAIVLAWLTE